MGRRFLVSAVTLALLMPIVALADDECYVSGYEQAFRKLRELADPGYRGDEVEDAIARFFESGEVDEGTYPPSEIWDRDGDLRRTKPPRLGYSGRFFFRYSDDDISGVEKWEQDYELSLKYRNWDTYLRFSNYNSYPHLDDPFRWEKGRLRYRDSDIKVTLGSYGQLFGHGLALNMYEDRTLDFDNEVEGAKVEFDAGDVELTALWGTRKERFEAHHATVGGARLEAPLAAGVDLGLHAVQLEFPDESYTLEAPNMYEYDLLGGDVTIRSGPFSAFAEHVTLSRDAVEFAANDWDLEGNSGSGYYLNASLTGRGYSFRTEYKNYEGLSQPFTVLPPVRRWSEAASADPTYDEGYGVFLNWAPFGDGSLFDLGYVQDKTTSAGLSYTEASAVYTSPLTQATNWVGEYWYVQEFGQKHNIQRLTVNRELSTDWAATAFLERENIDPGFIESYNDYIIEGELAYQSKVNVAYTFETTKQAEMSPTEWGLWEIKYRPDEMQEFNVVFGSRREGLVCSGGVCRIEPAFDGVKADYLVRF